MPRAAPAIPSLNSGELSPLLDARVDYQQYPKGLRVCENFVPVIQGPATKRPGTKFVAATKDSTKASRLVEFEFSASQAYILEFGDLYVRFYSSRGLVTSSTKNITAVTKASPAVVTATSHGFNNGDRVIIAGVGGMTELNNREFTVANKTTHTFELSGVNSSGYTTYTSGGTASKIYEIVSPYAEADLFELQFTQSADVIYIAHNDYAPRKLSRSAATSWAFATISFTNGPFAAQNIDQSVTVYCSHADGTGRTLTASSGIFTASMVGSFFRLAQASAGEVRAWESNVYVTAVYAALGGKARYGENYYKAVDQDGDKTGSNPPVHLEGEAWDGVGDNQVRWRYLHSGWGFVQITAFTSATVVTVDVISVLPDDVVGSTNATWKWNYGAWSTARGYPSAVTFYGDRLFWGGSISSPQTLWGSIVGDYENHKASTRDDSALSLTLNSSDVNIIRWMVGDEKGLLLGTSAGEWVLRPSTQNEALTPSNAQATRATAYGSATVQALRAGKAVLFVQRNSRKVREFAYVYDDNGFRAPDLTVRSTHISKTGFVDAAYQAQPDSVVWLPRADGTLCGLTYDREQEVVAWHRHVLGGWSDSGQTVRPYVESVATISAPDASRDDLWMIVRRYINGAVRRTVEYLTPAFDEEVAQEDAFFVDCGATYDGSSTSTITGLMHLEGQSVAIYADGATQTSKTVAAGKVTLDTAASVVQVGLAYSATLQTERMEAGAADGVAQGKTKRISRVAIRLYRSLDMKYGPDTATLDQRDLRSEDDPMDEAPPLFSGDHDELWPGSFEKDGCVVIVSDKPTPLTVLGFFPRLETMSPA